MFTIPEPSPPLANCDVNIGENQAWSWTEAQKRLNDLFAGLVGTRIGTQVILYVFPKINAAALRGRNNISIPCFLLFCWNLLFAPELRIEVYRQLTG